MNKAERVALLTGAAGFVGSHLAEALLAGGWRVRGLDAMTELNGRERKEQNLAMLERHAGFECTRADMRSVELEPLIDGCDAVFHLAALPGVRTSWGDAFREYSSTNIEATARLLEVCRQLGTSRFVYASSSSVYGNAERYPVSESDPTRPISPYGVSKLAGEHLARLYGQEFGLFTVSVRFFTVYGPRQRPDMAFHRFIRGILEGRECKIFGDGKQTRDFTYVADAVQSCIAAAERGSAGGFYNIGGGSRVTLREVIEKLERIVGRKGNWAFVDRESGDPKHTAACTDLAREELGYSPNVGLEDGLRNQVEWMSHELNRTA